MLPETLLGSDQYRDGHHAIRIAQTQGTAVGKLLAQELQAYLAFGYRFSNDRGLMPQVIAELLASEQGNTG